MYPTAIAMPALDDSLTCAHASLFGPTAGVRATFTASARIAPACADACGWPVRRHADGSIDVDAYRRAAAHERTSAYARLVWTPLRRLLGLASATTETFRIPSIDGDKT